MRHHEEGRKSSEIDVQAQSGLYMEMPYPTKP